MFWTIVIVIIGYILIKFFSSLNQDNYDLQGQPLQDKFGAIAQSLNNAAFRGRGDITPLDKRSFNLYENGQNQIILFRYGTGHLTIMWKYKYFQKEIVHERTFNNVRNLSIFEQQKIADQLILEMAQVVENHQNNVIGGGL
ncbi:MAG: hypothetical protein ACI95T_001542 [Flavobacteriales bacterium]|jgi:hypothetical protein